MCGVLEEVVDGLRSEVRVIGAGLPGDVDGPAEQARFRDPQGLAVIGALIEGPVTAMIVALAGTWAFGWHLAVPRLTSMCVPIWSPTARLWEAACQLASSAAGAI